MKKRGRNMRYRRSIYRKNGIHVYFLITAGILVAVVLLFVLLGNALGDKTAKTESERNAAASTDPTASEHVTPRNVSAYPIQLSADGSSLKSRISQAVDLGYTEVCFDLDTKTGTLSYLSDIAVSLGYISSDANLWKLNDAIALFDDSNLYTIGITHLSRMNTENDLDRQVASGYYTARIAEALRCGVDDVLILYDNLSMNTLSEITAIADKVHLLCPDSTLGISVTPDILSSEEGGTLVDALWNSFDYISVSLDQEPAEGENLSQTAERQLGGMLYYLLRYNMRVLIPNVDAESITQIKEAISANGVKNMLILP